MIINNIYKSINDDSIVVRKSENSMLVIAKKRSKRQILRLPLNLTPLL